MAEPDYGGFSGRYRAGYRADAGWNAAPYLPDHAACRRTGAGAYRRGRGRSCGDRGDAGDSPDGHAITDGETTYIWYDSEREVYTAPAGGISADNEQTIPTYEEILDLPADSIAAADYRTISGVNCIYLETAADEDGYVLRYWVSVDTGLLTVSERLLDGEPVYRMAALALDQTPPTTADFTLPDGTVLTEP